MNLIHRDIKPGNFLHNPSTHTFALVDFGLAHIAEPTTNFPSFPQLRMIREPSLLSLSAGPQTPTLKRKRNDIPEHLAKRVFKSPGSITRTNSAPDSIQRVTKKSMRAPRGGTRGFRAPEVLLKYTNQSVAIDIWSAGVILLCILSTRYPFFTAPDDLVSLSEIAALFGTREVKEVALLLNRKITFPYPQEIPKSDLKDVCNRLSSRNYAVPDSAFNLLSRCLDLNPFTRITAAEALRHPFLTQ
jgi:cell division control protein 7